MKRALITGITGQDGSYMAELLCNRGYEVHGMYRRTSCDSTARIKDLPVILHKGDVTDVASFRQAVQDSKPDELYHFADQDNVDWSYATPWYSAQVTYGGAINALELSRDVERVLIPISATVFDTRMQPQRLTSALDPLTPYACAKAGAWHYARCVRQVQKRHVTCPVLYNHDSPKRSPGYLLHKLARAAVEIRRGTRTSVELHDLEMPVDIGSAAEYAVGMHCLMQHNCDAIVCTGVGCTVKELWMAACEAAEVQDAASCIAAPKGQYRPGPRVVMVGDPGYMEQKTAWKAKDTGIQVVKALVEHYR